MDKSHIQETLKAIKDAKSPRNFKQTIDFIINFRGLDLKKQDNKIDLYVQIPHERGKKVQICGLVGPELAESAKKNFATVVLSDDFSKYDHKKIKSLAKGHQFFVAQANIMPLVATTFGKSLGPRGKMPNPKAGCVVPPTANLAPLARKLEKTVRIKVDKEPIFQAAVGKEDSPEEEVIENILALYNAIIHALPGEKNNIKDAYMKLTMGKAVKLEQQIEETAATKKKEKK